jgi:hypothetical protein
MTHPRATGERRIVATSQAQKKRLTRAFREGMRHAAELVVAYELEYCKAYRARIARKILEAAEHDKA